jgi:hypothetical protein
MSYIIYQFNLQGTYRHLGTPDQASPGLALYTYIDYIKYYHYLCHS